MPLNLIRYCILNVHYVLATVLSTVHILPDSLLTIGIVIVILKVDILFFLCVYPLLNSVKQMRSN